LERSSNGVLRLLIDPRPAKLLALGPGSSKPGPDWKAGSLAGSLTSSACARLCGTLAIEPPRRLGIAPTPLVPTFYE
jgi:hypothetical protein